MRRLLLIDENNLDREALSICLRQQSFDVCTVSTRADALKILKSGAVIQIICMRVRDKLGVNADTVRAIAAQAPSVPFLVVTSTNPLAAVELLNGSAVFGGDDVEFSTFLNDLYEIEDRKEKRLSLAANTQTRLALIGSAGLTGISPVMARVVEKIQQLRDLKTNVMIVGELGVGKRRVAKALHKEGQPFISKFIVNSDELNKIEADIFGRVKNENGVEFQPGSLQLAHGGILYLHYIHWAPLAFQKKLARFLETGEIIPFGAFGPINFRPEVRIIASANPIIAELVEKGKFDLPLYRKLSENHIWMPPLRERTEDIAPLITDFLQIRNREDVRKVRLDPSAHSLLEAHDWPGNIEELRNLVNHLVDSSTTEEIGLEELSSRREWRELRERLCKIKKTKRVPK